MRSTMLQHDRLQRARDGVVPGVLKGHRAQGVLCTYVQPVEGGINENTNPLLRRTPPKGTDLSAHSQSDLDAIALHHNAKPRK